MKKAQIQFNWIFVIVAGALILAFFIGFAMRYADLQNKKLVVQLSRGIENELDSLKTVQLYTEIPLGLSTKITFDCDSFKVNDYFSSGISDRLVASDNLDTKDILAWTQPWKFPYKIDNIFYLSSDNMKYFLVYDSNSEKFVRSLEIPKLFDVDRITSVANIKDIDKYKLVKVVFFTTPQDLSGIPGRFESAQIVPGKNEIGIVKEDGKDYYYFGLPMLYAAIFTNNYGCFFDKAMGRMDSITQIYSGKSAYLSNPKCNSILTRSSLDKLSASIRARDYSKIPDLVSNIEKQNEELYNKGCAVIF